MKQHIKFPVFQCLSELPDSTETTLFIKYNKLNTGQAVEQTCFKFANNPGDSGLRQMCTYGMDDGHNMGHVPDGR